MDRFVAYNKPVDFIGKAAAMAEKENGPARKLCTFVVDAEDADVWGDEPIWFDNEVCGFVTSGGYAHYSRKSVAIGFVPSELIRSGLEVEIEILGTRRKALMLDEPLYDPKAERMRG